MISILAEDNMEIDYSKLYVFKDPLSKRPLRLSPIGDWNDFLLAIALSNGKRQIQEPVLFKRGMGGPVADFLWSDLPPYVCISDRVASSLTEYNIRGWYTYPVRIIGADGDISGYQGFGITSHAGERDYLRSELVCYKEEIRGKHPKGEITLRGIYFNESTWDGSDIFTVNDQFWIMTEKVRMLFMRLKVTNVLMTPIMEKETGLGSIPQEQLKKKLAKLRC